MKRVFILSFVLLFCSKAQAQNKKSVQVKIAKEFCLSFINQNYQECWKIFDKKMNPTVDSIAFCSALSNLHQVLPTDSKEIELFISGVRIIQGKEASIYSFKYSNDVSKPAGFLLDVLFVSADSKLVAGFSPKSRMLNTNRAASSRGNETVISTKRTINIKNKVYTVRGVNIIHFSNQQGMVAIQVEKSLPKDKSPADLKKWAHQKGIKFAKWLYKHDDYQKALKSAKKQNIKLLPQIGVSFVVPDTGNGYNITIDSGEYQ
jgi:hypothetical protein